ncbi:phosphate/phosphite/phosphonate ABC transporter substrate-binding protein [bacterium]|nr:MAG: phosphate/phosphite/phosphonate ABC transporter substrate-binding protein [bacterium]
MISERVASLMSAPIRPSAATALAGVKPSRSIERHTLETTAYYVLGIGGSRSMHFSPISRTRFLKGSGVLFAAGMLAPAAVAAAAPLRVGMIPDAGATQVSVDEKRPLRDYLAGKTGHDVDLVIPTNYNATVEALGNASLDFAYLGGLTYVQAHARYGVIPLVQRSSDQRFHSLFITQSGSDIHSLADLRGKSFAFGDTNSTSGHLMPYYYMQKNGIDPDHALRYRFTGNHPATAKAVEAGIVDAGALDESVFHALVENKQIDGSKVRVFYTTPPFVDYVWVARKDLGSPERQAFADAFLGLREPRDGAVLDILRGKHFVHADDAEYDTLRGVARALGMM